MREGNEQYLNVHGWEGWEMKVIGGQARRPLQQNYLSAYSGCDRWDPPCFAKTTTTDAANVMSLMFRF